MTDGRCQILEPPRLGTAARLYRERHLLWEVSWLKKFDEVWIRQRGGKRDAVGSFRWVAD